MKRCRRFGTFTDRHQTSESCTKFIKHASENEQPMETVVLEKTIIKLGTLLALGFGEAGTDAKYIVIIIKVCLEI